MINRTPSRLLKYKTPYQILFGREPDFGELKVFGCLAFAYNQKTRGDKFASHSRKCVFLGCNNTQKGWKMYDLHTQEIFVSRDVQFVKHEFPFASRTSVSSSSPSSPISPTSVVSADFFEDSGQPIISPDPQPTEIGPVSPSTPSSVAQPTSLPSSVVESMPDPLLILLRPCVVVCGRKILLLGCKTMLLIPH